MQEIIRTLCWTFIHSLWQGLIAALLAAIIISSTRNAMPRLRYCLLSIVMVLFFATSVITFIRQWQAVSTAAAIVSFTIPVNVRVTNNDSDLTENIVNWINTNSEILILLWSFFFLLHCFRLITGFAAVNRLRHYRTHPVSASWKSKLQQLQLTVGIRRSVELLQSELVKVPTALGILKPVILLPLGLVTHLPAAQVETILLHELAHIRRKDYLINLLQHIAETIFFFNPAMRWLSFLIRQEREACCDDIVLANCNQKANYLDALINFQEYSLSQHSYAMRISCKQHYLLNRVKRMITNRNQGIGIIEKVALLAGVFVFSAFSFITKETEQTIVVADQLPAKVLPPDLKKLEPLVVKKEKKKINSPISAVTDTIPRKKNTKVNGQKIPAKEQPEKLKDPKPATNDADKALQEIIKTKDQIGLKKESIGAKKELLKTADEKDKQKIQDELERERYELQRQRFELERQRIKWQELKQEVPDKPKDEKPVKEKPVINKDKSATIQKINNLAIAPSKAVPEGPNTKIFKPKSSDIKFDSQEYQYKMDLQLKMEPSFDEKPAFPEKMKSPVPQKKRVGRS